MKTMVLGLVKVNEILLQQVELALIINPSASSHASLGFVPLLLSLNSRAQNTCEIEV